MVSIEELRLRDLPFVRADQEGIVEEVNDLFVQTYGWSPEQIIGHSLGLILPASFQDAHHLGFSRFRMGSGESEILNHPLILATVCSDQRTIESEHFIVAERHGDTWSFAATLRPLD